MDKLAGYVKKKNEVIVGHLPLERNENLAKNIFYVVRAMFGLWDDKT